MAQKTIRETFIELVISLRLARLNYIAKDSTMSNKTCNEYRKWMKASSAVFKFTDTPEFQNEIRENGIVTSKEVDAAFDAKFKKTVGEFYL